MKVSFRMVALGFLLTGLVQAENQAPADGLQPSPPPAGSVQLWNGHDLTGWVSFFKAGVAKPVQFWKASDGVLHLAKTSAGYLRTEKSFANYRLHVEWRWPGPVKAGTNNSGIFVLQHAPDAVWPYSVQVQVKTGATGDLISQDGLLFAPGDTNLTLKKRMPANENPAGEWNSTDIYCRGASIEVFVNGLRQNFVDKLPVDSGRIALQMEGYPVDFRNLWLQPL
jgi:hypothetical protein